MSADVTTCPDPLARAPRAGGRASLLLAPPSLQGVLSAVVCRDTRGLTLNPAQRLNHFPATPLVCLSWFQGMDIGLIDPHASGARWQALCLRADPAPSLRQIGRHWVQRLAWLAFQWRDSHSTRQIERRIKHYSGRSLREWRALVQTEGALFAALERHAAGLPLDLAGLAQEQGFADQAHLSRATKRITGFAPAEFSRRFVADEAFWLYRLWV